MQSSPSAKKALEHSIREDFLFEDHRLELQDCFRKYSTQPDWGLCGEAVLQRRLVHGWNTLRQPKERSLIALYLKELFGGFGCILWVAALFCFICWIWPFGARNRDIYNLLMALVLLAVIFIQGTFTFVQQVNSSNLTRSFQNILPTQSMVLREGVWMQVASAALVPGDIVQLSAGEKVPADLRCIAACQAKFEKSSITGESQGVSVTVECTHSNFLESRNLLFSGCCLLEGTIEGIVIRTGDKTLLGNIAKLSCQPQEPITSLQREINYFVSIVVCMALVTSVGILLGWFFWIKKEHSAFLGFEQVLVVCMISSVAFIPDGLPLAVTMTLSLAARSMCKVNILAKKLAAVETLGATTVIATDKTGTITKNCMSLEGIWAPERAEIIHSPWTQQQQPQEPLCMILAWLCGLSSRVKAHGEQMIGGNATEIALFCAAREILGKDCSDLRKGWSVLAEEAFSSRTKFHSISLKSNATGRSLFIIKGAPEVLLGKCTRYANNFHSGIEIIESCTTKPLTKEISTQILSMANYQASHGHRVLAIAYRLQEVEGDLIFAGLLFLMDPPREGVKEAIQACKDAGVRVMMVTGDHPATALSIASQVGIVSSNSGESSPEEQDHCKTWNPNFAKTIEQQAPGQEGPAVLIDEDPSLVGQFFPRSDIQGCKNWPELKQESLLVEGQYLDSLSQSCWDWILSHGHVIFARTTPMHKLCIVQHLQRRGEVVAVTGDGVNDAPALKRADIGIAMGKAGSEVSKEAANMILLDDDFSSIVRGIREGRLLFDNLRKVIAYLLSAGSFSEILPVLCYVFLGVPLPLSPFQMILICLGTDLVGAIAICHEGPESNIMRRPPRNPQKDRLVGFKLLAYSMLQVGLLEFLVASFVYFTTLSYCNIVLYDVLFAYEKWEKDGIFAGQPLELRLNAQRQAQTGFFLALVVMQMWNLISVRTRIQSSVKRMRMGLLVVLASQAGLAMIFCMIPWVQKWLKIGHPLWFHWGFPLIFGLVAWLSEEWRKIVIRRFPTSLVKKVAW